MIICINGFSAAADIYVNATSGDDANNGLTPATAKLTIKNATATVTAGSTVHIANGVYKGPNNRGITINKTMNILGQSQSGTIIDAEKQDRIFLIISGVKVTIKNLTLRNGNTTGNGGAIWSHGDLTVTSSTFRSNSAMNSAHADHFGNGGAISNIGYLTVTGSTFTGNSAHMTGKSNNSGGGGAIANTRGTIVITGSIFRSNTADVNGGAIVTDSGTVRVSNSTFTGNAAGGGGGAILNGFGLVTVTSSIFRSNTAGQNAGAILNGGRIVTVIGSIFTSNTARVAGGAIANLGGPRSGGTVTINRSTLSGNTARQNGGAIISAGAILRISISNLTRNIAQGLGGAIYNELDNKTGIRGSFTVTGSNLTYNTAKNGGAIYNIGGNGVVHFNRIYRNTLKEIASPSGRVDAMYNWWGSNTNPSNKVSGNVIVRPWLIATITARPGGSLIVTVSILYDSSGNYHDPNLGHVPDGIPVSFYSTNGIFNPPVSYTVNGRATSHYTQAGTGLPIIWAIVDDQLLRIGGEGPQPSPSSQPNTVPMQDTGMPLNLFLMALLAITGGLLLSGRK